MTQNEIPLIDFSKISNHIQNIEEIVEQDWIELSEQVRKACHDIGFMYIVNHGIDPELVKEAFDQSLKFFNLPLETKKKFLVDAKNKYRGYACPGQEKLSPNSSLEFREAFAMVGIETNQAFPEQELPNFRTALVDLQVGCNSIVKIVLKLMARALDLDENYFIDANRGLDDPSVGNRCTLRTHFYPEIPSDVEIPSNAVRCGAHTDYGSCTFLFQDNLGGLEVLNAQGKWIPAIPIENSILINLGDIMEKWTASYFRATCHRILIPESERQKRSIRQSIAYFIQTDDDYLVSQPTSILMPHRASFEPFTFAQYLDKRIGDTFQY